MNSWDITKIKVDGFFNSRKYNSATCCNGGGYPQGRIYVTFRCGYVMDIQDDSCGDFGFFVGAGLRAGEGKPAQFEAVLSNMENWSSENHSTFPEWLVNVLDDVWEKTGYAIPTKQNVRDGSWGCLPLNISVSRLTKCGAEWWDGDEQFPGWNCRETY